MQMLLGAPRRAPSAGTAGKGHCQRGDTAAGRGGSPSSVQPRGEGVPGWCWTPGSSPWTTVGIPSAVPGVTYTRTARGQLRGGTQSARLVARTWWHLKVIGKGKERETWPLPWLPPNILQHGLQAVTPGWVVAGKEGMDGSRLCRLVLGKAEAAPQQEAARAQPRPGWGGASMHNHPPNAPKSCSGSEPTQGSGLGSSCRRLEPGSELGSDPRSPSASALPSNQRKQQLGVEQSQMKDVADVSLLPSSLLATWDTMLPGPHPRWPPCHPVARDDGHRGGRWHLPAAPAAVGNRRRRPDRQE